MKQILNLNHIDTTKQPIFFGEGLNIQQYTKCKYEWAYKAFQEMLQNFWRPEEVSLKNDSVDFDDMPSDMQEIFLKNLKYQILLDSVQSRGIPFLSRYVSLPEIEAAFSVWQMSETVHSYSYTYIIKNLFPSKADAIFNSILMDEEIVKRANSVTHDYDELIRIVSTKTHNKIEEKRNVLRAIISVFILESLRFYVSFSCSFAFAQNSKMEGNAKIIGFIMRDENIHMGITKNIINSLRKNENEGFQSIFEEMRGEIENMFKNAIDEEILWADYLMGERGMLGLSKKSLAEYIKWLCNNRMKMIGLTPLFHNVSNPFGWLSNWTNSKNVQIAAQETENEAYKIASVKPDLDSIWD